MKNFIAHIAQIKVLGNEIARKRIVTLCLQVILAVGGVAATAGFAQAGSSTDCRSHIPDPTCH